jgi:hypothetical protein
MHTYIKSKNEPVWTVGYYAVGLWHTLRDYPDERDAAAYVSYLNGGDHPRKPFPTGAI